jgi:drug/metabolite transporter (DMT)-like permease
MSALNIGAAAFGAVIGWMTYRILARKEKADWSDLSTVIATVGGAAVLSLFPAQTPLFGAYAIGLFIGFFGYFVAFIVIARAGKMPWIDILTGKPGIFIMKDQGGPLDDG